ncbi:hypothetical protein IFO70_10405 [Phormidium tenue FACHB-886]|nr:hypothetical protein [Phormidium tenue FACHB-886]
MQPDQPFTPIGSPLPREVLLKQAEFTQAELNRAIATAHPSLKPYLEAKPDANLRR